MLFRGNKKIIVFGLAIALICGTVTGGMAVYKDKVKVDAGTKDEKNIECSYSEIIPTIRKLSKEYAVSFANKQLNKEVESGTVTPIYDMKQNIVGYSVGIINGDNSYGYVNLDFTKKQVVSDFSLQDNTRSMYTTLVDEFVKSNKNIKAEDCSNKLYNIKGPDYAVASIDSNNKEIVFLNDRTYGGSEFGIIRDNYAVCYKDTNENNNINIDNRVSNMSVADNTNIANNRNDNVDTAGEDTNKRNLTNVQTAGIKENIQAKIDEKKEEYSEKYTDKYYEVQDKVVSNFINWLEKVSPSLYSEFFGDNKYEEHYEVFIEPEDFEGNLEKAFYLDKYDSDKSLISQETIMTSTNRYACALVGILEIVQQEDMLIDGDMVKSFNTLWDIANCDKHIESTETFYGDVEVDLAITFGPFHGNILKKYGKLVNKKVSYKYKLKPSFNTLKGYLNNQNDILLEYMIKDFTGHGVNVVGYCEGDIGDIEANYLIVANGWDDDAPRYIAYDPSEFVLPSCTAYSISDR